jgi:hypothetical protein
VVLLICAMIHLLNEYLLEHKALYLKETGLLVLRQNDAVYDMSGKVIHPPQPVITILDNESPVSLQLLASFIGRKLDISEEHAFGLYNQFCQLVHHTLLDKGEFAWEPLGTIQAEKPDAVPVFELNKSLQDLQQEVSADRVVRQGVSHTMQVGDKETTTVAMQEWLDQDTEEVKDRWWIFPLVLGISAIGLIVWKRFVG